MLTRRDILKIAAVAVAGCGSSSNDQTFTGNTAVIPSFRNDVDVAIIGAGMAGLAAAQTLLAAGLSVQVLEARDRPGGRCYTDNSSFLNQPVDIGAQYFHQADFNPLLAEALAEGVDVIPDTGAREFRRDGRLYPDSVTGPAYETIATMEATLLERGLSIDAGAPDVSTFDAAAALRGKPWYNLAAAAVVNSKSGLPLQDPTSTEDWANFLFSAPFILTGAADDFLIPSGMGNFILRNYLPGVPVALSSPVTRVNWGSNNRVTLETPQGNVNARFVIITSSMGVLQSGRPNFSPVLPSEYQSAIHSLPMGVVNKLVLQFNSDIFGVPANSYQGPLVDSEDLVFSVVNMFSSNITISFVDGDLARELEREGQAAAVAYGLELLSNVLGNQIRSAYSGRHLYTTWGSDPWSLGSWANARPGQADARQLLGQPIANQMVFAGEAVLFEPHGALHAAQQSGVVAAGNALAALKVL